MSVIDSFSNSVCILLLTPAIEGIYYWDCRKKSSYSTKNCNYSSRLPLLKKCFVINSTGKNSILPVDFEGNLYNSVILMEQDLLLIWQKYGDAHPPLPNGYRRFCNWVSFPGKITHTKAVSYADI